LVTYSCSSHTAVACDSTSAATTTTSVRHSSDAGSSLISPASRRG
jgi:hypothetical protein